MRTTTTTTKTHTRLPYCSKCGRINGPFYRANEKGVPAIWCCEFCMDTPVPELVRQLCDMLNEEKKQ